MIKKLFLNDTFILSIILLNTLVIFIGGYLENNLILDIIDNSFTVIFLLETFIKIDEYHWKNYIHNNWNKIDFIIVLLVLPSLLHPYFNAIIPCNTLLILRTCRIFKIFKLFKHIPHIKQMLNGIILALRSSFVICIAFVVFLIIISTLTFTIFGKISPEYFGTPCLSLYNTFRIFTIEGWYEIPDYIATHSSYTISIFARIYFVLILFLGGFLGMPLINSIFVDAMASDNNDEVLKKLQEIENEIKQLKSN